MSTDAGAPRLVPDPFRNPPELSRKHFGLRCLFRKPRLVVFLLLLPFAIQSKLSAQELSYPSDSRSDDYDQSYSPNEQVARPRQPLSAGQLEQLVAPIALYPDALVAQILAASTYPEQIREADSWRQEWSSASPERIVDEADAQPWDASVKALTAFPQVLTQMDRNLQWTTDLGNAYYNQPEDVLEAVQVMRRRAQAAGNLQSTPQEIVHYNQDYIELVPANPQVVYVPAYNPWTVYGEPVAPYPGFTLLGALGEIFGATPLQYGVGIAMAAFTQTPWGWLAWGLNWLSHALLFDNSAYYSNSATVADWGFRNTGFHTYARGGFERSKFGRAGVHGESWRRGSHTGWRGNSGGPWHSFARYNTARRDTVANHWNRGSAGFHSFSGRNRANGNNSRGFANHIASNHAGFGNNFHHDRAGNFRQSPVGSRPSGRSFGSRMGSYRESSSHSSMSHTSMSHASMGRSNRSASQRLFGKGHSQKSFGGREGRSHFGGGGHAPKSFGSGRSFHASHSGGGGHSGGHGGSKHHR